MASEPIRTDAVKAVLDIGLSLENMMQCRGLTEDEMDWIRVYLQMNAPAPRKPRSDRGTKRAKAGSAE